MYTEEELGEIRNILTGKRKLSNEEIGTLREEFGKKQIPDYIFPFIGLFVTNHDLYRGIFEDERAQKYSLFGFFPETFEMVYGSEVSPEISFDGGNRGLIGIIKHPKRNIVIKPIQSNREPEIAKIADELGVGPKQYISLDGFLTEQFIEGDLFSKLKCERKSTESMYNLGRRVGEILKKLHSGEIYYNDTILCDDFGRSHVIIPEVLPAILFDYGVAIKIDQHPNFSDEEVYNFARTLPMVNTFLGTNPSQQQIQELVRQYRPKLEAATKEQIMARDIYFIEEGLSFAASRLGNSIAQPFSRGFKETYKI